MFSKNKVYKRSALHDRYGGNRQSGICPCAEEQIIFIFSGKSGHQYGYVDGWDENNVFAYTGEGTTGDMQFIRGNRALRDHSKDKKKVFLFTSDKKSFVKFEAELELIDWEYFETHDFNKKKRKAIRFYFKQKGVSLEIESDRYTPNTEEAKVPYGSNSPNRTERKGLVTSRVGQGAYRKSILLRWDEKCAVTGCDHREILIASHIVPWRKSTDKERLDVHNGILLSPLYDALFDKYLISFENSGKIILSKELSLASRKKLGVTGKEMIKGLTNENKKYLEQHRILMNRSLVK